MSTKTDLEDWDDRYEAHVAPIRVLCVNCLPAALAAVVRHEEEERAKWVALLKKASRSCGAVGNTGST